jgi:hypothetical protein
VLLLFWSQAAAQRCGPAPQARLDGNIRRITRSVNVYLKDATGSIAEPAGNHFAVHP